MSGPEFAYLVMTLAAFFAFIIVVIWVDRTALPYSVGQQAEKGAVSAREKVKA